MVLETNSSSRLLVDQRRTTREQFFILLWERCGNPILLHSWSRRSQRVLPAASQRVLPLVSQRVFLLISQCVISVVSGTSFQIREGLVKQFCLLFLQETLGRPIFIHSWSGEGRKAKGMTIEISKIIVFSFVFCNSPRKQVVHILEAKGSTAPVVIPKGVVFVEQLFFMSPLDHAWQNSSF